VEIDQNYSGRGSSCQTSVHVHTIFLHGAANIIRFPPGRRGYLGRTAGPRTWFSQPRHSLV